MSYIQEAMERIVLLRDKASLLSDTIFTCFMLAFGRDSAGEQQSISPKLRIHEQAVLLAVILNVQASIIGMSRVGSEQANADKQSELMRSTWLLGSEIVFEAVDKFYTGYICGDIVPGRAVHNKSLRMIVPARCVVPSVPALDNTNPKHHDEVLAQFVTSGMEQRLCDGYAMFTALLGSYELLKVEVRRLIDSQKKPKAQTSSLLYYLSHLPMVLSNYGAQPMLKTSAYSKEHAQLFGLLHDFATMFWAPGVAQSCPQLREVMLEVGIAITIMSLKRNAGTYGRLTVDPACVPDVDLTTRISKFCLETEIPSMSGEDGVVWNFICGYNQVHPMSSGRPSPGSRNFSHPLNKSTALHHWMLHVLLTNLRALADTTVLDDAPILFSYKMGSGTSNTFSLGDLSAILAVLPTSSQEAIDDDRVLELLQNTTTLTVLQERLRVLEHLSRVVVVRYPRFTRGKNQYWAMDTFISLPDLEKGMLSMGHMIRPRNSCQRLQRSRSITALSTFM